MQLKMPYFMRAQLELELLLIGQLITGLPNIVERKFYKSIMKCVRNKDIKSCRLLFFESFLTTFTAGK